MKQISGVGLAVVLLAVAHGHACAAESVGSITEIEVSGQRSLLQLRQEISQAEDAVFGLWNELNDEALFDIHCVFEAPVGSLIKRKQCMPRFVAVATEDNRRDFFQQAFASSGAHTVTTGTPFADVQKYVRRYQQKMKDTILQNPALQKAVLNHQRLLDELDRRKGTGVTGEQARD